MLSGLRRRLPPPGSDPRRQIRRRSAPGKRRGGFPVMSLNTESTLLFQSGDEAYGRKDQRPRGMLFLTPPGQAEVSASGAILPEALAPSFPSVAVGVPDASGRTNPVAFMSNVLCCVPAGEDFLAPSFPSVAVGVPDASGRTNPVAFMSNVLCCVCLQNCQERKYFRGASLQISPEYARRFQPGGKELWKKSSLKGASGDHQVFQPRRTRREMGEWGSNS
ncbi:uncharacterized protein LOC127478258 [Manacus candei]|uniref:uncharacterized protein LOC127478258 n=1 Tax=Manacus candei TaxID=415023 RepID=UPI00222691E0|nr:uncharacterized protein LOC127478258 [Manacus candei]